MPAEGGQGEEKDKEAASEVSIMQKLLMPAAEVLAMDATDYASGDRLLKGMGKKVNTENPCPLSGADANARLLFWKRTLLRNGSGREGEC